MNGTWGMAEQVPGAVYLSSVSCGSAGNCSAGGGNGDGQAFVVDEVNGIWSQPKEVPGLAALNAGGSAQTNSVSCPPGGTCGAGGYYTDSSPGEQAFVVTKSGGGCPASAVSGESRTGPDRGSLPPAAIDHQPAGQGHHRHHRPEVRDTAGGDQRPGTGPPGLIVHGTTQCPGPVAVNGMSVPVSGHDWHADIRLGRPGPVTVTASAAGCGAGDG